MAKKETAKNNRARRKEVQTALSRRQLVLQWSSLTLIGMIIAAIFLWPKPQSLAVSTERLTMYPFQGTSEPKVTIVEFADFGCPACQAWHHAGIREQILETYSDKVQFVWRDFPVITAQSPKAAEAGQCAFDQAKFWEFHDLVYERGRLSLDNLKSYAQELGLNTGQFNQCLDSGQYKASIDHNLNAARELRLRGTPSFIVNDRILPGPPGYAQLASIIDAELANN